MKFEILSVAEDGYESNRITAAQRSIKPVSTTKTRWNQTYYAIQEIRFSLDVKRTLTVREYEDKRLKAIITFDKIDIDSLIEYLQQVKTFISEEEMVAKLMGTHL